ncbi:MAG: GNAT family N-acetyltransferase [bacterium]
MIAREKAYKDIEETKRIDVQYFADRFSDRWDTFVWNANNGSLFHTRRFLNYHPKYRFQDVSLVFSKGNKWLALLPAAVEKTGSLKSLVSHPGTSFAGFVLNDNHSIRDVFRMIKAFVQFAHKHEFAKIILTIPPQIYYSRPSNYLEFALLEAGFVYQKREVSSVIPLDFSEEDILTIFSPESSRAVRKAIRCGVQVHENEDLGPFYGLLEKNLKLRHNVQPTHTLAELQHLKRIFPDRIRLFEATLGEKTIAGIVLFICNAKVALAFYVSHDERMQEYRAVNFLFYHVIRWAIWQRLKFLDFGIFTVNMKPNWGLARFKESFGAQGIFRDTLVKEIET